MWISCLVFYLYKHHVTEEKNVAKSEVNQAISFKIYLSIVGAQGEKKTLFLKIRKKLEVKGLLWAEIEVYEETL